MRTTVFAVGLGLALAGNAALGQWSEPVVLGDSCYAWVGGPALVATRADTIWAIWRVRLPDYHDYLTGRRFAGDSWAASERLTPDSSWYQYPDGLRDEQGRVLVAYYRGSYPISGPVGFEDWGIYTVTRTDTGWSEPELAHDVREEFPFGIRLGRDRQGGVAMTWEEGSGGIPHTGSVMLSRRTPEGWTPRRRLAQGNVGISYGGASLVPGDSTDFYLAFSGRQREPPYACSLQVWTADDTLVAGPTRFGGSGLLARTGERRYLALRQADSLFASVNRGQGWEPPALVSDDARGYYWLAADSTGFAWLAWTDSLGQAVLASYHAGNFWARPETVALGQGLSHVRIAATPGGRAHCCWLAPSGGLSSVHWATRQTMPGVEDAAGDGRGRTGYGPTIVRGALRLDANLGHDPGSENRSGSCPAFLLDATGRRVMELQPGENDVRHLSPGVYFVRGQDTGESARLVLLR
ncbi:MAG: hypothetical protein R6X12_09390 [bacterium]